MLTISATVRKKKGKTSCRRLRLEQKIPAIIYGNLKESPIAIWLNYNIIHNLQNKKEFYHNNLFLIIDQKEIKVKIQTIQYHAFKPKLIHIDFIRI